MNPNDPTKGWLQNLVYLLLHAASVFVYDNYSNIRSNYDRNKLELEARHIRADMSQQYGETTERIRSTRRDLGISKGTMVGIGIAGAAILIRGGNKAIQKLKNEQNTTISELRNELTQLQTALNQAQQTNQENFNKVHADLEGQLNANASGGTGGRAVGGSSTGGNVHIDGMLFSQMHEARDALFDRKIEGVLATPLRHVESKFDSRFNTIETRMQRFERRIDRLNDGGRVSQSTIATSGSTVESTTSKKRGTQPQLSMTAIHGSRARYEGSIPQDTSLLASPLTIDQLQIQKEELVKHIEAQINERLASMPPDSDATAKMKPFFKDEPEDEGGGNPGLGAGTSQVEVNYLFISNNNFNLFPSSTNLINTDKLINFNGFSSSKLIKPIVAQSDCAKQIPTKLNNITDYLIPKNSIKYNLNDNLDNSCINNEYQVDITIINKSSIHPELINDIKLFNIINNDGSTVYNTSSIEDSNFNFSHRLNANQDIQPNRIINLNKNLFKNDNLESFSIADSDINQSVVENNNIIQLCNVRQILHNKWLTSRLTSYPLIKDDFNQSLIEDIVDIKLTDDIIPIFQTHDLTKTSIITKNLNINQYINIKKTNNTLCLNNSSLSIEPMFVSHALYIDFLDLVYCELFFNQQLINLNMSCFIYGSIFIPSLFILNGLGYLFLFGLLTTTFTLFNSGLDIVLKTFLNKTNYSFIKNIFNNGYSLLFNSLFLYIIWLNITNIALVSNLILLKGTTLYGGKMLKDLHKSNSKHFKKNVVIHKNILINPLIYRNKMEL